MTADALVPDLTTLNYDRPLFGIEEIRSVNCTGTELRCSPGSCGTLDPTRHVKVIGFGDMRAR